LAFWDFFFFSLNNVHTVVFSFSVSMVGMEWIYVDLIGLLWMSLMADMYKNQLQELAQRSCFNLPSYACIREGPDHAPRFKASVNFNGEIFESPSYCTTLRQAEHAAAEVALTVLSTRGPSRSLTARVLVSSNNNMLSILIGIWQVFLIL
jgi:hypothetical protein